MKSFLHLLTPKLKGKVESILAQNSVILLGSSAKSGNLRFKLLGASVDEESNFATSNANSTDAIGSIIENTIPSQKREK